MKWFVEAIVAPYACRLGGQTAAVAVGVGLHAQYENAAGAIVAWLVITAAELIASDQARKSVAAKARDAWGRN